MVWHESKIPPSGALERRPGRAYTLAIWFSRSAGLETHGPFGTLWVGIGLGLFYLALIWLNTLLGFLLTPLFVVPATWLMDKLQGIEPEP